MNDDHHVPARNDRRLARAGDEYEAHREALEALVRLLRKLIREKSNGGTNVHKKSD